MQEWNKVIMKQVKAVIFDWAGTIVDFGSFAPTQIFVEAFKKAFDFDITLQEARGPMGLGKRDHINTLLQMPDIAERWIKQFGHHATSEEVDLIYNTFMPLQIEHVVHFAKPVTGALDVISDLREQQIKIGSCSGYPRAVMDALIPAAAEYGYQPDCVVASDDLAAGSRPGPWMALQNVIELGIEDVACCIKVDDSVAGIEEGLNAGMWTVALSVSGNEFGATEEEYRAMSEQEARARRTRAENTLRESGTHYVTDTVTGLPQVVADINERLMSGERP